jgi:hypothetical protein
MAFGIIRITLLSLIIVIIVITVNNPNNPNNANKYSSRNCLLLWQNRAREVILCIIRAISVIMFAMFTSVLGLLCL